MVHDYWINWSNELAVFGMEIQISSFILNVFSMICNSCSREVLLNISTTKLTNTEIDIGNSFHVGPIF